MRKYTIIDPDPTLQNNLMAFGFECDAGWYPMIIELMDKIQDFVDNNPEYNDLRVMQVKEKFAGLRVYMNYYLQEIDDLIDEYESRSYKTCEICGADGKERENRHWYKVLCDKDYEEWIK